MNLRKTFNIRLCPGGRGINRFRTKLTSCEYNSYNDLFSFFNGLLYIYFFCLLLLSQRLNLFVGVKAEEKAV